jgi:hypothetical protein
MNAVLAKKQQESARFFNTIRKGSLRNTSREPHGNNSNIRMLEGNNKKHLNQRGRLTYLYF